MAGSRALAAPRAGVHRVSRSINVFAFRTAAPLPNPASVPIHDGNRWDDAQGNFATVYCASSAEGAFGEVIARYRERPGLLQRIDAFLNQPPDPDYDPLLTPGVVPAEFFDGRWIGHSTVDVDVRFVDVDDPATHAALDPALRRPARLRRQKNRPRHLPVSRPTYHANDRQPLSLARADSRPRILARPALPQPPRARLGMLGDMGTHPPPRKPPPRREDHTRAPRTRRRRGSPQRRALSTASPARCLSWQALRFPAARRWIGEVAQSLAAGVVAGGSRAC